MLADAPTAFFSYSREDSEFALRLAQDLREGGASVWIDQLDIQPGEAWDSAVEQAVTRCQRMVVILSPISVKSTNVRNEIVFALDEKKIIVPVLYQDCVIPLQLRRIQYTDFRTDYARSLKILLKTLGFAEQASLTAAAASAPGETQRVVPDAAEQARQEKLRESPVGSTVEQPRLEKQRRLATEQRRLEEERKQAAERARLEEERSQAAPETAQLERKERAEPERERTFPTPIVLAAVGIVIVGFLLYWATRPTQPRVATTPVQRQTYGPPPVAEAPSGSSAAKKVAAEKQPATESLNNAGSGRAAPHATGSTVNRLRNTPKTLDVAQAMAMLKANNLYDNRWNPHGRFANIFRECTEGGVSLIYDAASGLLWARPVESELSLAEASATIARLNAEKHGGHSSWRLPTLDELSTLLKERALDGVPCSTDAGNRSCIDPIFRFSRVNPQQAFYWSGDTARLHSGTMGTHWGVMFMSNAPQHYGGWGKAGVIPVFSVSSNDVRLSGCPSSPR